MNNRKVYFGAANGYSGFRSNFNSIFSPDMFEKIFIIKGGPGTGKSTLMKRIDEYCNKKYDITVILCSSDPESYDGIIIYSDEKRIALIDGTSPHVVEPIYPGAVEEIINLGDSFDYEALRAERGEIVTLSDKKKTAYRRAYDALGIAGKIYNYIKSYLSDFYIYNTAEMLFDSVANIKSIDEHVCKEPPFLIGSFSRSGYKCVENVHQGKKKITIGGDGISEYILLTELEKLLTSKRINHSLFSSPFAHDIPDMIETFDTIYVKSVSNEFNLDSTELISENREYSRLSKAYQNMMESSRQALEKAAEYHFALEHIYSKAVRFSDNEKQYYRIVESIDCILDK